jgi:flagellar hook protein FlgE
MLRSMFSGVSGLRSHQAMMDVVGNNVANVNTSGFKSSRATFQEALTQVQRGATAATPAQGGINPFQLGLGARTASVDAVMGQGALQLTGRSTDLAIQGEGMFVVERDGAQFFSRAGAFNFDAPDAAGVSRLVGPGGERVQGYLGSPPDEAALVDVELNLRDFADVAIGVDGSITGRRIRDAGGNPVEGAPEEILGAVAVATFGNTNGLEREGNSLYRTTPNSGAPDVGRAGQEGRGVVQAGTLEMSNVDLAQEFTNLILAQRGFQANSRLITSSDEMLQDLVNLKR